MPSPQAAQTGPGGGRCGGPWACGGGRRDAHRPAAYLNIFLTLVAFVHGSLILQEVYQSGPVDLAFPWLTVADLELDISFSLSLTNLVAL